MRSCGLSAKSLVRVATMLVILIARPAIAQEWAKGAPPSDERRDVVGWVSNDTGEVLLARWEEKKDEIPFWIYVELHLPNGMEFNSTIPSHKIDDRKMIENDWQIGYGERNDWLLAKANGSVAYWMIWGSKEKLISSEMALNRWISGSLVEVTYETINHGQQVSTFTLNGFKKVLLEGTGIALEGTGE